MIAAIRLLRDGVVIREAVLPALPVVLGRGPDCDFVLADASVSRAHARLDCDAEGRLVLTDLGSRNGLYAGSRRLPGLAIRGVTRCRLGNLEIEVVPVSEDPTVEVPLEALPHEEHRRRFVHHAGYLLLGVSGAVVMELLNPGFWSPWQRNRASELVGGVLAMLIALPLFAFLLFVALKAAGRRVRVADTLRALARIVWLLPAFFVLRTLFHYLLPGTAEGLASQALLWATLVAAVLSIATLRRPGKNRAFALAWAAAVTVLWAGLGLTSSLAARRLGMPQNDYAVRPPVAGASGVASSLDAYLEHVRAAADSAAQAAEDVRVGQEDR